MHFVLIRGNDLTLQIAAWMSQIWCNEPMICGMFGNSCLTKVQLIPRKWWWCSVWHAQRKDRTIYGQQGAQTPIKNKSEKQQRYCNWLLEKIYTLFNQHDWSSAIYSLSCTDFRWPHAGGFGCSFFFCTGVWKKNIYIPKFLGKPFIDLN